MAPSRDWPLVLAYHHVTPTRVTTRYAITADDFERQLAGLLAQGFSAMSLHGAIDAGEFGSGACPPRTFTLTFDDGFASFRQFAEPVLARLGLLGATTVFVPTAFVGDRSDWIEEPSAGQRVTRASDFREPCMSWDDLARLAERGVCVGSHGHRHLPMNELTYEDARSEAAESHAALAAHGFDAAYLALPFGWASSECRRAVRDAGFDAAFAVERGGGDRYEIRRIPIYGGESRAMVRLKLSGRYFGVHDAAARLVGRGRPR